MNVTVLIQNDELYAPPDQPVLVVSVVDDVASLQIGTWDEDDKVFSVTDIATVSVSLKKLMHALQMHELNGLEDGARRLATEVSAHGS